MRNAWKHVEALQTSDVHGLMRHIGAVIEYAINEPDYVEELVHHGSLNQTQESLVFYYLTNLMQLLDAVHEER